jgi:hypothetical protein
MKKHLNTDTIANELRGSSLFFRRPQELAPRSEEPVLKQDPPPDSDPQTPGHLDAWTSRSPDVQTPGRPGVETRRRRELQVPGPPDAAASRHLDSRLDLTNKAESR